MPRQRGRSVARGAGLDAAAIGRALSDRMTESVLLAEAELAKVVAHGGALTFVGTVRGRSAHAAMRLEGVSALDRYVPIHRALAEHERRVNTDVAHPLMRALPLPYPLLVGRLEIMTAYVLLTAAFWRG